MREGDQYKRKATMKHGNYTLTGGAPGPRRSFFQGVEDGFGAIAVRVEARGLVPDQVRVQRRDAAAFDQARSTTTSRRVRTWATRSCPSTSPPLNARLSGELRRRRGVPARTRPGREDHRTRAEERAAAPRLRAGRPRHPHAGHVTGDPRVDGRGTGGVAPSSGLFPGRPAGRKRGEAGDVVRRPGLRSCGRPQIVLRQSLDVFGRGEAPVGPRLHRDGLTTDA